MTRLLVEDDEKADKQKRFYDEYYSVLDLPAEFYLQTIKSVFQDFDMARGNFRYKGSLVDISKIKKPALMVVEGERDDIAGVGQTKAALDLCTCIPKSKKEYYLQLDAGHYGIFSGSKFRKFIAPRITQFIKKNSA